MASLRNKAKDLLFENTEESDQFKELIKSDLSKKENIKKSNYRLYSIV